LAADHSLVCISRSGKAVQGCAGVALDITEGEGLNGAFAKADVVVHAAGLVSHEPEAAARTWAVHVDGTRNVLAAAVAAKVKRVVHLSTSGTIAVSDDPNFIGAEDSPDPERFIAQWPYYRSKRFAEQLALEATEDLEVVVLNPALLLGPGDEPNGASTRAVAVFLNHGVPLAPPGGLAIVDVRDVAAAVELALEQGQSGERYLLAGANLRFVEFFSRIARMSDRSQPMGSLPQITRRALQWFPNWGREQGIGLGVGPVLSRAEFTLSSHFWYADSTKARTELGWTPRGPNETLGDTVVDLLGR
jgi:dihydroflavonol-4-reductase